MGSSRAKIEYNLSYVKIEYNFFDHKVDAKYIRVEQLFQKKQYFQKTTKNCFRSAFDHFLGKGDVLRKKLIQHFLHRISKKPFVRG